MAQPDFEDRYSRFSFELDASMAFADFSRSQKVVLRDVFAQRSGPARVTTAMPSPARIAEEVGPGKQFIARAIRKLRSSRVLIGTGVPGECRFNEDHEEWTRASPRKGDGKAGAVGPKGPGTHDHES